MIHDPQMIRTRAACGVPDDENLWIATWLFHSPLTSRPSGDHNPDGFGFSGFLGELRRARRAYAELRVEDTGEPNPERTP